MNKQLLSAIAALALPLLSFGAPPPHAVSAAAAASVAAATADDDEVDDAEKALSDEKAEARAEAQGKPNEFILSAGLLTRGELRAGGLAGNQPDIVQDASSQKDKAAFIMERTRLTFGYRRKNVSLLVTGQHAGVWGQTNNGTFNLYEAWAQYHAPIGLFVKVGRQALSYDDERIIGLSDWTMTGSAHDVLLTGYEGHGHKVHAFFAFNQNAENVSGGTYYTNGSKPYKTMQTLWYHYDFPRVPLGVSALFMNSGLQSAVPEDSSVIYQQLAGTYIKATPGAFTIEGSLYFQFGRDVNNIKIRAWMASLRGECKLDDRWTLNAGYDHLSGDRSFPVPGEGQIGLTQHKVMRGFSPLYGSNHKFYGAMEFFYVRNYINTFSPGLQTAYAGAEFKPIDKLTLDATYSFMAATASMTNCSKPLGHMIEFEATWKVLSDFKVSLGYSYMAGTKTMERLRRTDKDRQLNWLWLSLNFCPKIFSFRF